MHGNQNWRWALLPRRLPSTSWKAPMLIRLGYEIAIECPQPTPLISLLEIHDDRQTDIKRQTRVLTSPSVPSQRLSTTCSAMSAGASSRRPGRSASSTTRSSRIAALPDEVNTLAARNAGREAARRCLGYLLGSRYCETDHHERPRLVAVRPSAAGLGAGAGDLRLRAQPPVVRLWLCARDPHRCAGAMRSASASAATSRIWRSRSAAA